jgi:N-acetylmuramoyl-L-alanine amidase
MNSSLKRLSPLLGLITSMALFSCAVPSGSSAGGGYGRDEWGHRPGPKGFTTVILDAGHGGHDSGAVSRSTGAKEKDLTLDMVKRIEKELGSSFRTVLMRHHDAFIDLDDRVARANHYPNAILVSVHFNSGPAGVRGPETYYWRVDSHGLAVRCQRAMAAVSPAEQSNRGMVRRRLRLTRNPEIPCLLLECGYLSNPAEAQLVQSPAYRQKMAAAIAQAIREQSARGDAGTGTLPPPLYAPPSRPTDAPE